MKAKCGKYYLLNNENLYFSVDLQRLVKFDGILAVKCENDFISSLGGHFGKLINTSEIYDDIITDNDIIFTDEDIIDKYKLHKALFWYMDFPFNWQKHLELNNEK